MSPTIAPECPGSNPTCSLAKNSVAPQTAMLSRLSASSSPPIPQTASNRGLSIPPLDPMRFGGSFEHFRSVKGITHGQGSFYVGERAIDLYSLHEKFMNRRGYEIREVPISQPVQNPGVTLTFFFPQRGQDFWVEIGRELNIIGSHDVSSASSRVADQLAAIYRQYLEPFDMIYVLSFRQEVEYRETQAKLIGRHPYTV